MGPDIPSLKDLALNSLCCTIARTVDQLVEIGYNQIVSPDFVTAAKSKIKKFAGFRRMSQRKPPDLISHYLEPTCKFLEDMVSKLPCSLANEVTYRFMMCIFFVEKSFCKISLHDFLPKKLTGARGTLLRDISTDVFNAVFHPSTTVLHFPYLGPFSSYYAVWIPSKIEKVKNIRVIKSDHVHTFSDSERRLRRCIPHMSLEEFTYSDCSDQIIQLLVEHSAETLRVLDVSESFFVTDDCIENILKFKKLVRLNVDNTKLTPEGLAELLLRLSERNVNVSSRSLQMFGGTVTASQVKFLQDNFPNLSSLKVRLRENCKMPQFQNSNLTRLHVSCLGMMDISYNVGLCMWLDGDAHLPHFKDDPKLYFDDIKPILQIVGNQLVELKLDSILRVNMEAISSYCPNLQHLTLNYSGYFKRPIRNVNFPFLESLCLNKFILREALEILSWVDAKKIILDCLLAVDNCRPMFVDVMMRKIDEGRLKTIVINGDHLEFVGHWRLNYITKVPEDKLESVLVDMMFPKQRFVARVSYDLLFRSRAMRYFFIRTKMGQHTYYKMMRFEMKLFRWRHSCQTDYRKGKIPIS
ncbi:hypothetical protein C0J52_17110 [Blattella germanica]|nr:hypothetical protein C0J52_17110 [Blattella germanica]